jgi:hypothetical protein
MRSRERGGFWLFRCGHALPSAREPRDGVPWTGMFLGCCVVGIIVLLTVPQN